MVDVVVMMGDDDEEEAAATEEEVATMMVNNNSGSHGREHNNHDGGGDGCEAAEEEDDDPQQQQLVVSPQRKGDSPEVAKLQELVKKLERQNEQLRRARKTGARRRQMSDDHQQLLEFQQIDCVQQQQQQQQQLVAEELRGGREPAGFTSPLPGPPCRGCTTDFQPMSPASPVSPVSSDRPSCSTSSELQTAVPDGAPGRHHHRHQHRHHRRHRQQQLQQQQQHQFGPSDHCPVSATFQVASDLHSSSDLHPISPDCRVPSGRPASPDLHTTMPSDLHLSSDLHTIAWDRLMSSDLHPMTPHLHVSTDHRHPIPPDRYVSSDVQVSSERQVHAVSSDFLPASPDLQPPSSGPVEETLVELGGCPDGILNIVPSIDLEECGRWEDDTWLYTHPGQCGTSERTTPNSLQWCRRFLDSPSLEMEAACRSLTSRLNSTMSGSRNRMPRVRGCNRQFATMDCGGESPKGANLTFPTSTPILGRHRRSDTAAVNDCGSDHVTRRFGSPLNTFGNPEIKDSKGSDCETPLNVTEVMNGTQVLDGDDSCTGSRPSNISELRLMVWLKEQKQQQQEFGPPDNETSQPICSSDVLKECIQVCDFDTTCIRKLTDVAADLSTSSVFLQCGVTADPSASPSLPREPRGVADERQDGDGSSVSGPVDSPGQLPTPRLLDFIASSDPEEEEGDTCGPLSPCTDDVDPSRGGRRDSPSDRHPGRASRLQTPLRLRALQSLRTDGLQQQRSKQLMVEPGRVASGLSQPQAVVRGTEGFLGSQQRRADVAGASQAKGLATSPAATSGSPPVSGSGQTVRSANANAGRAAETRPRAVATIKQPALRPRAVSGPATPARSRLAQPQRAKAGSLKPGQSNASPNDMHVSMPNLNSTIVRPALAAVKNSLSLESNLQDPATDVSQHCKNKTGSSIGRLRLPTSTSQSRLPCKTTPPPAASGASYQPSSPGTAQGGASGGIVTHKGPSPETQKTRSRLVAPSKSLLGAAASDRVVGARAAGASSPGKSGLPKPAGGKTSPNSQPCSAVPRSKLAQPTQRPLQIQRSFGVLKDSSCSVNY